VFFVRTNNQSGFAYFKFRVIAGLKENSGCWRREWISKLHTQSIQMQHHKRRKAENSDAALCATTILHFASAQMQNAHAEPPRVGEMKTIFCFEAGAADALRRFLPSLWITPWERNYAHDLQARWSIGCCHKTEVWKKFAPLGEIPAVVHSGSLIRPRINFRITCSASWYLSETTSRSLRPHTLNPREFILKNEV
jgi:hypothetical protein